MQKIDAILRDSGYFVNSELFTEKQLQALEDRIITSPKGEKVGYAVECLKRGKIVPAKPEEIVRQLYLDSLINHYRYPKGQILVEMPVTMGADSTKRADIVVMNREQEDAPFIIIELKKNKARDGKDQLKSYCNATGAPIGVWTNGRDISYFRRKDPNIFDEIRDIPSASETLQDILDERFTILDLMKTDRLQAKPLKRIIEEFEDEVLANAGVDVFEEAFKLVFTKLFDEHKSGKDKDRIQFWLDEHPGEDIHAIPEAFNEKLRDLQFRNTGDETATRRQIEGLFEEAKKPWPGIFDDDERIKLTPSHLQTVVSYLEGIKLFNSNLEVVDDAFEYLVNKDAKGEKGQYFTPRYVIDLAVKMLHPQPEEYMIDTAAGSCGFPVHTIFHVWQQLDPNGKHLFTTGEKTEAQKEYVRDKVFAIDFDEKTVRVGRTLNLIAGDGETNVLLLNSLDYERWEMDFNERKDWRKIYGKGFGNLEKLRVKRGDYRYFNFDVLMANPPFAGDIKDQRVIRKFELAKKIEEKEVEVYDKKTKTVVKQKITKEKGWHEKISRDILFVERNLDMLRPGGRMAIVLPQGRFNNSSDKTLRQYIAERGRILAVVGLHSNTFKPHTGTKTSLLFIQKWNDDPAAGPLCPRVADYPIFFATMQSEGKNNSGEKLYWKTEGTGTTTKAEEARLDAYGHAIVYHDLFGVPTSGGDPTPEGIAEAFAEFARKEKLPFFP